MNNTQSLSHSKWECKYHFVWIPKCRWKLRYGQLRKNLGEVFHELARQKESKVFEGLKSIARSGVRKKVKRTEQITDLRFIRSTESAIAKLSSATSVNFPLFTIGRSSFWGSTAKIRQ